MSDLPIIRTNSDEIRYIYLLFAAQDAFEKTAPRLDRRLAAIPYGKRDLKTLHTVLTKLLVSIMKTLPDEKKDTVARMARHAYYHVSFGVPASKLGEDECIVKSDDLNVLIHYAFEQCKLCLAQSCNHCPLGRVLDHVLTVDRDGGSWAFMQDEVDPLNASDEPHKPV